jgi:hypothetical protein
MKMNFIDFANYFEKCAAEFDEDETSLEPLEDKKIENEMLDGRLVQSANDNVQLNNQLQSSQQQASSIKQIYDQLNEQAEFKKQELLEASMQKNEMLSELDGVRQQITEFLLGETQKEQMPEFGMDQIPGEIEEQMGAAPQLEQAKMMEQAQMQQQMMQQQQKMQQMQQMNEMMQQQSLQGGMPQQDSMQQMQGMMPGQEMAQGAGMPVDQSQMQMQQQMGGPQDMGKMSSDRFNRGVRILENLGYIRSKK